MAKKNNFFGILFAGTIALITAAFLSKKQNRTKTVRVAKKLEKSVVRTGKKLAATKRSGIKRK